MRILIIDEDAKARIAAVVAYAKRNVFSMDDLLDIKNGHKKPAGDDFGHVCQLETFRVVYSLEDQVKGMVRHMSISLPDKGALPNPVIVEELMKEFGFIGGLEDAMVAVVPIGEGRECVDVLQYVPLNKS